MTYPAKQFARVLEGTMRDLSLADMHERLGRSLEVGGKVHSQDHSHDANGTPLRGLSLDCTVRRLSGLGENEIALAREEMGEARWQQLNKEWDAALDDYRRIG